jgi:hypothetical protein
MSAVVVAEGDILSVAHHINREGTLSPLRGVRVVHPVLTLQISVAVGISPSPRLRG